MLIISKINDAQSMAGFIRSFVNTAFNSGGVLRNIRNLGDRIAPRMYKDNKGKKYTFVRYLTFDVDCDPNTMLALKAQSIHADDILAVHIHKLNMNDYYKSMIDREYFKRFETNGLPQDKEDDFIVKNTAKEIIKKIKEEGRSEEDIFINFGIKEEVQKSKLV